MDARHAESLPEWVGMLGAWDRLVEAVDRLRRDLEARTARCRECDRPKKIGPGGLLVEHRARAADAPGRGRRERARLIARLIGDRRLD
jgi:hypothetical protein